MSLAVFLAVSVVAVYLLAGRRFAAEPSAPAAPVETGPAGASAPSSPDPDEKAPALALPGLDGKTIDLAGFSGKVVLVDFWATWCGPCKEEIPDLVKLRDKLKDKGFEIMGVSMDDDGKSAVRKFAAKIPISYPVALNNGERAPAGWDVPGLPTAYLVGRHGEILKRWFGEKDMPDLEKDVTGALAK